MSLAHLVTEYGYGAVLVGSLLEGETVLLLAGMASHHGYLSFPLVVAIAFCGGTLGDQLLFHMGRRHGAAMLRQFPTLAVRSEPVARLIRRHQNWLIFGVRFMYGLRLVGPVAIGMSEVSAMRFAVLNLIGAAVWALLVTGVGYLFGQTLSWLIADLGRYEALALLAAAAVAGVVLAVRWLKARRN
ncbi:DedA family protein [Variovorax humicola]|jgi:membrane protein DedA with SNARE-associated domain|uniref:DedA family protein n=1 Tax=Variovorax humicola TaxID=1769758 RepID=A0ABU8W117_9BURK